MQTQRAHEAGVSIVEVVVGMSVFALLAGSLSVLLAGSGRTLRANETRVQAAAVLNTYLEAARAQSATDIADGTTTSTVTHLGDTFSVTQSSRYVASVDGGSLCATDSVTVAYRVVSVTVTWPDMAGVHPVRGDTAIAFSPGEYRAAHSTGSVAVHVVGSDGVGLAGAVVTATPSDGGSATEATTDSVGCATVLRLPATESGSTYTITVHHPDLVNTDGTHTRELPEVVVYPHKVARPDPVSLVGAATVALSDARDAGATSGLLVWLQHTGSGPGRVLPDCAMVSAGKCLEGFPGDITGLIGGDYLVGLVQCTQLAPQSTVAVSVASGSSHAIAELSSVPVSVRALKANGDAAPHTVLEAVPVCGPTGGSSATVTGAVTSGSGEILNLLPGQWKIHMLDQGGNVVGQTEVTVTDGSQQIIVQATAEDD